MTWLIQNCVNFLMIIFSLNYLYLYLTCVRATVLATLTTRDLDIFPGLKGIKVIYTIRVFFAKCQLLGVTSVLTSGLNPLRDPLSKVLKNLYYVVTNKPQHTPIHIQSNLITNIFIHVLLFCIETRNLSGLLYVKISL